MKKLLAAIMMLALVIGLSACGSKPSAAPSEPAAPNAQSILTAKCATCHGQNLEGMVGPKLSDVGARLTKDQIATTIKNGGKTMPPNTLTDQKEIDAVAEYLAAKK